MVPIKAFDISFASKVVACLLKTLRFAYKQAAQLLDLVRHGDCPEQIRYGHSIN